MDPSQFPPMFRLIPRNPTRITSAALMFVTDSQTQNSSSTEPPNQTVPFKTTEMTPNFSENYSMVINHRFNGRNYLQWSQSVLRYIHGKRKEKYINGVAPQPTPSDPNFDTWFAENNQVMTWLCNSMTVEINEGYLLAHTTKEIWDIVRRTYSSHDNTRST